ncbi:MAG: PHP domain-containing protein, partial [Bacteroidota bacterium]
MKNLLLATFTFLSFHLFAQHSHTRVGVFPDIGEYLTLKVDLHIHTVFSDGSVWPDIRVQEALRDSLDLVSMTEHLEYQPHEDDIPHPDRNRSYELTAQLAKPYRLMVANGAEITRSMPPGHNNAIFIKDANKLRVDDPMEAFKEANRQGAFVFLES